MYDCIIIGSGIAGAAAARILAEEQGKKVLVLEKKHHIGGNCYDGKDEYGILVHWYGPHIFHTGNEEVYEWLSRFTDWYAFGHEVVARVGDKLLPVPFNLNTLKMVYGEEKAAVLEKKLVDTFGFGARVPILKLREQQDEDLRAIADYVYENVFLRYTMKQWGQTPEEIDPAVTGRVPVVISYDNRYFGDKYQGMPRDGFTPMFEKMLAHPNIEIRTNTNAKDALVISEKEGKVLLEGQEFHGTVIYTGPVDELFDCRFGRLPYRTLRFDFEHYDKPDYQGHSVVNYTVSEDYTRITEFKYLTGQKADSTTIVKEYPFAYTGAEGEIPYYAIMNEENNALYRKYADLAAQIPDFHLLGRLAEYKYYNIDAMAAKAIALARSLA
ncbi:UDP-galactopyranose mutase [Laedolimicola intestinihominis]|uniref:UDP-galactopyranose mutase n=1 Tax=Laedolimicola intestinihominis TaxID=3133166 RepID=A0ABV1FE04_9FIRM